MFMMTTTMAVVAATTRMTEIDFVWIQDRYVLKLVCMLVPTLFSSIRSRKRNITVIL